MSAIGWGAILFWGVAMGLNFFLAERYPNSRPVRALVATLFGVTLLVLWQGLSLIHI